MRDTYSKGYEPHELICKEYFSEFENLVKDSVVNFNKDNPDIAPRDVLKYDKLCELHTWMSAIHMHQFSSEVNITDELQLDAILDYIELTADRVGSDEVCWLKQDLPIVGLDLETTGLNVKTENIGGALYHNCHIVGICLGIQIQGREQGFYIPVLHNELDGIKNFNIKAIQHFLEELSNRFFCVYANAFYDVEVLHINGIKISPTNFIDIQRQADLNGLRELHYGKGIGLKFLASHYLKRDMIELKELVGDEGIYLEKYSSSDVYVYGCSDAVNTLALFYVMNDMSYTNKNKVIGYDTRALFSINSITRHGLPLYYKKAKLLFKTMLRRKIIITRKIEKMCGEMLSNDKLGVFLYNIIFRDYNSHILSKIPESNREKAIKLFKKKLYSDFKMKHSTQQLKDRVKDKYSVDRETLGLIVEKLHEKHKDWGFIDEANRITIMTLSIFIIEYRSLVLSISIYQSMLRNAVVDDRGYATVSFNLKPYSTSTTRFANSKGSGLAKVHIGYKRKGVEAKTFIRQKGEGGLAINAQGFTNIQGSRVTLRKIKKANMSEFEIEQRNKLDLAVEAEFKDLMIGKV